MTTIVISNQASAQDGDNINLNLGDLMFVEQYTTSDRMGKQIERETARCRFEIVGAVLSEDGVVATVAFDLTNTLGILPTNASNKVKWARARVRVTRSSKAYAGLVKYAETFADLSMERGAFPRVAGRLVYNLIPKLGAEDFIVFDLVEDEGIEGEVRHIVSQPSLDCEFVAPIQQAEVTDEVKRANPFAKSVPAALANVAPTAPVRRAVAIPAALAH